MSRVTMTLEGLKAGEQPVAVIRVPLDKDNKHACDILTAALCAEAERLGDIALGKESA